jgi:hypothetical protein
VTGENETLKQSLVKVEQLERELADLGTRFVVVCVLSFKSKLKRFVVQIHSFFGSFGRKDGGVGGITTRPARRQGEFSNRIFSDNAYSLIFIHQSILKSMYKEQVGELAEALAKAQASAQ